MAKDWTGNSKSIFVCNGASNHTEKKREEKDYYATEPKALELLLDLNEIDFSKNIWECACGELHLSNVLKQRGYSVRSSDIVDRVHNGEIETLDFLTCNEKWNGDIITNPPYKQAKQFVEKALDLVEDGNRVAMFLKLTFLESKSRRELFNKKELEYLYVSSSRLQCAKNGDFDIYGKGVGTAVAYGWYIFKKGFNGEPRIRWFN